MREAANDRSEPPLVDFLEDPLGFILAPVSPDLFLKRHHERAPLLCTEADPARFATLLTPEAVDSFIDTADLRGDMVTLARAGRLLDRALYVSASGRVIPSALAEQYLAGATIILQHLHDSLGQLGALCRALEPIFSAHAQTNIYMTPPGEQGFAPHADTHDVFVLQLTGSKAWRLYRDGPQPVETLTLRPGDCLYLPRGIVHDAVSVGREPSLHITVGLVMKSWGDLLAALLAELRERDAQLAAGLPRGYARPGFDRAGVRRRLASMAEAADLPHLIDAALDRVADDYRRDRRPQVGGVFEGAFGAAAVPHKARPLVQWRLMEEGRELVLIGPGGDLRFDIADREALAWALSGRPFLPADLPCPDPCRLFRRLWSNGYVEPARR